MSFFTSGMFWFIEGIFVCLIFISFKCWAEDRGVNMAFWKWMLLGLWLMFLGFTIAFVSTSAGENEMTAATLGGIIFGLISVISAVGLWRLLGLGKRA